MNIFLTKKRRKAQVLDFLGLINLHDAAAAQEQFEKWLQWCAEEDAEDYKTLMTYLLADWGFGYCADWKDTETLVCQIARLAARRNLKIDWSENLQLDWGEDDDTNWNIVSYNEEEFNKIEAPDLLKMAGNSLKKQGYTLGYLYTGSDEYEGWMTESQDDESIIAFNKMMVMGELQRCTERTTRL